MPTHLGGFDSITVGVTGHLEIEDLEAIARAVAEAFDRLDQWFLQTNETPSTSR